MRIRTDILACRLVPGQKLVIAELCAEFEFSLGAVREALARLTSEGLVVSEPRKGFKVAPITEAELRDITRVRATIESLCLENAIRNGDLKWETNIVATQFELSKLSLQDPADPVRVSEAWADAHKRFHEALVAACDSPWLLHLRDLISEHRDIADAAVSRDVEKATMAIRAHLEKTTRILIESDVVKAHEG
ncbi:GntR family transcriptional regulator [Agrobacterium leguminum]|uniref:GntR family transcriptional regulator n=1 Tax=Agrobacterium leguminum TaxID=2792015 RepID=UPI003CE5BE34